jgi:hypothetical protein
MGKKKSVSFGTVMYIYPNKRSHENREDLHAHFVSVIKPNQRTNLRECVHGAERNRMLLMGRRRRARVLRRLTKGTYIGGKD